MNQLYLIVVIELIIRPSATYISLQLEICIDISHAIILYHLEVRYLICIIIQYTQTTKHTTNTSPFIFECNIKILSFFRSLVIQWNTIHIDR